MNEMGYNGKFISTRYLAHAKTEIQALFQNFLKKPTRIQGLSQSTLHSKFRNL